MSKVRVAVLRGGPEAEYDVSMQRGAAVLSALTDSRFEPVDIVLSQGGEWLYRGYVYTPQDLLELADVVFPTLHGVEDGAATIPHTIERIGIPYVGSPRFSTALSLNTLMTKDALRDLGITMARHMMVDRESKDRLPGVVTAINNLFGPRYVVKPVGWRTLKDVQFADNKDVLLAALTRGLGQHEQLIVEERIEGTKAVSGVLSDFRDQALYVFPPIESTSAQIEGTSWVCPGRFSYEVKERVMHAACLVHQTLGLSQYSQSDFIVAGNAVYFLRTHTIPELSKSGHLEPALDAVGSTSMEFVTHLVKTALTARVGSTRMR